MRSSRWNRGAQRALLVGPGFFRGLWLRCCMQDIGSLASSVLPRPHPDPHSPTLNVCRPSTVHEVYAPSVSSIAQSPAKSEMTPSHETNAPLALGPKIMGTLQGPVLALSHTLLTLRMPAFA